MQDTGLGVKAIVENQGKYLVLVKPNGRFDLPGGRVEVGETKQQAVLREIEEETGYKAEIMKEIGRYGHSNKLGVEIQIVFYFCQVTSGFPRISEEHVAMAQLSLEELEELMKLNGASAEPIYLDAA